LIYKKLGKMFRERQKRKERKHNILHNLRRWKSKQLRRARWC
jgi:hypothetical protein